jgi:hypothetical protein
MSSVDRPARPSTGWMSSVDRPDVVPVHMDGNGTVSARKHVVPVHVDANDGP